MQPCFFVQKFHKSTEEDELRSASMIDTKKYSFFVIYYKVLALAI